MRDVSDLAEERAGSPRARHAPGVHTERRAHARTAPLLSAPNRVGIRRGCWSRKARLCRPVRRRTPSKVRCTAERSGSFSGFQTWDVAPEPVTDSSIGARRGPGPPYRWKEASRRGDQKAAGCPSCLPASGPVRPRSYDWPTCWDFRSRVSLWWCDALPRGHDGGGATAALPMSPAALKPSLEPPLAPLELPEAAPVVPGIPAASRTPVLPPADCRAARRDRPPPGGSTPGPVPVPAAAPGPERCAETGAAIASAATIATLPKRCFIIIFGSSVAIPDRPRHTDHSSFSWHVPFGAPGQLRGQKHSSAERDYPADEALTQKAISEDGIFGLPRRFNGTRRPNTHEAAG